MILTSKRDKEQIQKLKNDINRIQKESKKEMALVVVRN